MTGFYTDPDKNPISANSSTIKNRLSSNAQKPPGSIVLPERLHQRID